MEQGAFVKIARNNVAQYPRSLYAQNAKYNLKCKNLLCVKILDLIH